nr:lycopene cyclase domain-containing protein [Microbacterium bovistercoris]
MTYLILCLIFLGIAAAVLVFALAMQSDRRALIVRWCGPIAVATVALLVLTAIFDNVMIASGLMTYQNATTSGVRIGLAPVEDFAYPLAGVMLLPALWLIFGRRRTCG